MTLGFKKQPLTAITCYDIVSKPQLRADNTYQKTKALEGKNGRSIGN